jgi:DNA-binding transcriptional LysR family regulator
MDRFREIETFVAVVNSGSFVGASDRLRISKSVVSRIIQDLEGRLGGRLLQRSTRSLALTDAGEAYYERCNQILADLFEAEQGVGDSSREVTGTLKMFTSVAFDGFSWASSTEQFLRRYPKVNLDLSTHDRHVDLIGEGYDLAIIVAPHQEDSSMISRKLATTKMTMCASPDYLMEHGTPASIEDLQGHSFIGTANHLTTKVFKNKICLKSLNLNLNIRLMVNDAKQCRSAALAGLGIVYQPNFLFTADLFSGELIEVMPGTWDEELGIYAVYPTRKHLSGKVRAMVDFLVEIFDEAL